MIKPEWYELFEDPILRQYLFDLSKSFSKDAKIQEKLYKEAWLVIGQLPAHNKIEYYMHRGFWAMMSYHNRVLRKKKTKWLSWDATIRRASKKTKKYLKKWSRK